MQADMRKHIEVRKLEMHLCKGVILYLEKQKKSQNILWAPAGGLKFHLPWIRCQSAIILTNATNAANLNIYATSPEADMRKHENTQWGNEKCTKGNHICSSDSNHIQATFENPHRVISEVKTGHQKKRM